MKLCVPVPSVDCTRPEAPAPAPPAPLVVPPAPAPGAPAAVPADSPPGRVLHHAGVDAAKNSSRFGTKNIGVCDRQVVASDGEIQIIFQRKINRILQRQIEFAIVDHLIQPRRIGQRRLRNFVGRVCIERIVRFRHLQLKRRCWSGRVKSWWSKPASLPEVWPPRPRTEERSSSLHRFIPAFPAQDCRCRRSSSHRRVECAGAISCVGFGVRHLHDGGSLLVELRERVP